MPRGASDIPDLRLARIQKLVTNFMTPPELMLSMLFGETDNDSDTIKWESQTGNRGMTPFVPPGHPAPQTAPIGVASHSAVAAFMKEKMYFDEEFLNNLRQEGTESQYLSARQRLARELLSMTNRVKRRKEWMFAKMLVDGTISYEGKEGVILSVDYGIPSSHSVTLGTDYKWEAGSSRDIWKDITDGKLTVHDDCNGIVDYAMCNSTVLKFMASDDTLQTILQKQAFGQGDLFSKQGSRIIPANAKALGNILDIKNFIIYDEAWQKEALLTANLAASGTTVYVQNTDDFETGSATLYDISANTNESVTISAVNNQAGTLTISASSAAYIAGEDKIVQTKKFLPDDKFVMFASRVDGQQIAEWRRAPFGLDRHYGVKSDQWEEKDPEGVWIRIQDKGLPLLFQKDAIYVIDVN